MAFRRLLWTIAKVALFAVVIVALWRTANLAVDQLQAEPMAWRKLKIGWLIAAGLLYLSAQVLLARFWQKLLQSLQQNPKLYETTRAFIVGQLGKYVPGKMVTVVIRAGLVRSERVGLVPATISIFFETLIYMAVGSCLAAFILIFHNNSPWQVRATASAVAVAFAIGTWPPVIRRLVSIVQSSRASRLIQETDVPVIDLRTWLLGWVYCSAAWALQAISLWATIRAIPNNETVRLSIETFFQLLVAVTMAVVAGFASFLPAAGLGVREWVLDHWLAEPFGPVVAIVSAILLRIVWLLTEIIASAILYLVRPAKLPTENNVPGQREISG